MALMLTMPVMTTSCLLYTSVRGDGNKEETAALRREVRELRGMLKSMLTSVVKNTKDARDFLEEFEESGLPPQRVNA